MPFLEHLVKKGLITEAQISEIIRLADEKYKGDVDQALNDFNIDSIQLLAIRGVYFNLPVKNVDPKSIAPDIFKYIPLDSASLYKFAPIGVTDGVLEIGVIDPDNIQAMDALQFIAGKINMPFKVFLISHEAFKGILDAYRGISGEVDQALSELDKEILAEKETVDITESKNDNTLKKGEEEKIVEDAPIIKIVAVILRNATEGNASDIHIENAGDKVKVRFRVDGILHTSLVLPISVYSGVVARIKILAKLHLDEKRKPQDGGFSAKIDGRKIDFRVSTMPSYFGEKIVMRILDSQRGVKPLEDLDLSPENLALIRESIKRPYGLILVTGPTGSGKTTTLYSMLNELNKEEQNIVSLEDPVEYQMQGINQSQVQSEIGYTFASGLRSILRQDPNVIFVGEIRDKETAELAIQASLTGHLVFSTLHTNSAVGAIPRLVDMGIDPYLISPTIILVIAQRLSRRICPSSKKPIEMDDAMKVMIEKQFADLDPQYKSKFDLTGALNEAVASPECPSGTRGRVSVFEMFKVDKEMQSVILKNPIESEIYRIARANGMITMREDAIIKSIKGSVPFKEIYNL
ncbi:type II/IV secretion system protein [Candidatus Nomurabacteria bacterium]|nr:type II/IV secretion system protein [Candidatus Nomurabacteria bacterium]